ncbi:endoplasmic reticulum vesicle transporter-domain-containing protein [Pelagophyceae sp. CCMP2097]|nr:endoplasmic reticulum vesicle transporter-domain-containing protein [Pelagophyceae sp. CCMP2097]
MKSVNFYSKVPAELTEATLYGSFISIVSTLFILAVLVVEIYVFSSTPAVTHHVGLDVLPEAHLRINVDVTFPRLACSAAVVQLSSVRGHRYVHSMAGLTKVYVDASGMSKGEHLPQANDVNFPGCQLKGFLHVEHTPARLEVSPPTSYVRSEGGGLEMAKAADLSHTLNHFSFGEPLEDEVVALITRLDRAPSTAATTKSTDFFTADAQHVTQHYIHVVPTRYQLGAFRNKPLIAFQTLHHHHVSEYAAGEAPAAQFIFDVSPMTVVVDHDMSKRWYDFITNGLAVTGGTFAVGQYFNTALSGVL